MSVLRSTRKRSKRRRSLRSKPAISFLNGYILIKMITPLGDTAIFTFAPAVGASPMVR